MNTLPKTLAAAALTCAGSTALGQEYNVTQAITVDAEAAVVWATVGGFCDIAAWHPGIVSCVLDEQDGRTLRTLTLGDGAVVVEGLITAVDGQSYTYDMLEAPLPVANYTATLSLTPGRPTTVTWTGRFTSEVPEMEGALQALYDSGLAAIAAMFDR